MGQNLTGQTIASTYEDLVQISGSYLTDGTGSDITNLTVTVTNANSAVSADSATSASYATFAESANTANSATTAGSATTATSASHAVNSDFATTASFALNVTPINTGSFMVTGSVTSNTLTFEKADGSTFNLTVDTGSAVTTPTGSLLVTASISDATITFTKGDASTFNITVNNVLNADSASVATSANTAISASHAVNADNAITASYALNVDPINTGSFYVSSSVNNATITFTQGDGSTEAVTVNNVLNADSASYATTADSATTATSATSASHAISADTASLAQNIVSGLSPTFTNVTVTNDLTVNGTASIAVLNYVTGSATYIGDSFIVVNTDLPAQRYAGLAVFDSGSTPQISASLEWDGEDDVWLLKEETENTSVILTGPTGSRGAEIFPTQNKLQKGGGWNYIVDSSITDDGTTVSIDANVDVTGSVTATTGFVGNLTGNADTATSASHALFADNAGAASTATSASHAVNADSATSASYATSALSSSYALTASFIEGGIDPFPYTGSVQITGSLAVTGSYTRLSGSFSGSVIDNITDVYTSTAAIEHVISLTQAEYNSISASADPSTLYYITDAPSFVISASYAESASYADSALSSSHAVNSDTSISSSYALTASYAEGPVTLGSNTFTGDQIIQSASLTINGPVYGGVSPLTISSNTASMDLTVNNFFTLTLVSGSDTYINPSNITAGQTINLRVTQANPGNGTVSFPSSVKQVSGSAYVPTAGSGPVDIVTFIAFDNSSLYLSNVKNLI